MKNFPLTQLQRKLLSFLVLHKGGAVPLSDLPCSSPQSKYSLLKGLARRGYVHLIKHNNRTHFVEIGEQGKLKLSEPAKPKLKVKPDRRCKICRRFNPKFPTPYCSETCKRSWDKLKKLNKSNSKEAKLNRISYDSSDFTEDKGGC